MEISSSREIGDVGNIKRPQIHASLYECNDEFNAYDTTRDVDELRQIWSSGSLQSPHSSLPTQSKLVSALKGSREKHGISQKKLSVTWAPSVYDPFPTSLPCMIRSKKQRKLNKTNDKKKIGKKGQKGYKSSRGTAGGKCGNNGSSYRWYTQLVVKDCIKSMNLALTPGRLLESSFVLQSSTMMHYSSAEAL